MFPTNLHPSDQIAVIMTLLADPKAVALFLATNARLYDAFLAIDDMLLAQIKAKKPLRGDGGVLNPTWAMDYQNWMTDRIASQNALIQSKLSALSATAASKATAPVDIAALKAFNQAYNIPDLVFKYQIPWSSTPRNINFGAAKTSASLSSLASSSISSSISPFTSPLTSTPAPPLSFPDNVAGAVGRLICHVELC